jgi:hypothetical protein
MSRQPRKIPSPEVWVNQILTARQARDSVVVRRFRRDVRKFASSSSLMKKVLKRGFQLIRTVDQYVVLCHKGDIKIYC